MFGKNKVLKVEHGDGQSLDIVGIFHTIQGEGPLAGQPAIFIRLYGCNLRCHFCDTDFESNAGRVPLNEIMQVIEDILTEFPKTSNVVITGGEPMRQNILPLCRAILMRGLYTQIETAGTSWIEGIQHSALIVCSPKTPRVHDQINFHCTFWKYIVKHGEIHEGDGLPNMSTQNLGTKQRIARPPATVPKHQIFIQACDEYDVEKNKLNLQTATGVALRYGYTVSIQQHKILGVA